MDYLDQERDRGITITSAAITFPWRQHQINLIDTPGHVDFTMEVERSMVVLDGGVMVLDGSAGVEAQTMTVWRQADRYNVPRIAYINKLDKPAASIHKTVHSIQKKLSVEPLVTQMALGGEGKQFFGLVDLVSLNAFKWRLKDDNWGKEYQSVGEAELKTSMFNVWEEALEARQHLIETAADHDSDLAEKVIEAESFENISESDLKTSLRRIALNPECGALVTFLGSSYTNIGVQPLIDAIIDYCPSPGDRQHEELRKFGSNFCGMVFKIVHHPMKGVLSFVRIYSGKLSSKDSVYNINQGKTEKFSKMYLAFADEYMEAGEVEAGNIVVISGLKLAQTGDTLVLNKSILTSLQGEDDERISLVGPTVPDPVVFCSVEPPSLAQQKQFDQALSALAREDPSLRVSTDQETGQTVLGGMGELHLEIVRDRIMSTYKVEVELGKLQVAYREMLEGQVRDELNFTRQLGDKTHSVTLELTLEPVSGGGKPKVVLSKDREAQEIFKTIRPKVMKRVVDGILSGLDSGPLLSFPVQDCLVTVHSVSVGRGSQDSMVSAGASNIVRDLVARAGVRLAEPVMGLEVTTEQEMVGPLVQDIIHRRGQVHGTSGTDEVGLITNDHDKE